MQLDLFKNYLISFIRTAVPIIVGLVISYLATQGVHLNDNSVSFLTFILEGVFGMLYYLVVRALEHLNYRFGWLLGYAKMPVYVVQPSAAADTHA